MYRRGNSIALLYRLSEALYSEKNGQKPSKTIILFSTE